MVENRPIWIRNPCLFGLVCGWLIGMLWWSGFILAAGPSARVTYAERIRVEEPIPVSSRLLYAPLVAIPWAVIGLIVGAVNLLFPGEHVLWMSFSGTVFGGAFCLLQKPFDGWLALSMPVYCFIGTAIGLVSSITRRKKM